MTRRAPQAAMACCSPGQSAWSLSTKPRSSARRRRAPRSCIQPEAKASEYAPKRFIQAVPAAEGGASTSARLKSAGSATSETRRIGGSVTPLAAYASFSGATAPCTTIGPIEASTAAAIRCALPKA